MANLHDAIAQSCYEVDALERLLVRLLFCLFADDTGIFEPAQFELYLQNRTREDGSDLGAQLYALFEVLNKSKDKRSHHLEEDLAAFPFVNGELFAERLPLAGFTKEMRTAIIAACHFDWSRISPAIFGSLFQGIMDNDARRQIGAHYTSERDILKVIRPLFLDSLREEFEKIKQDTRKGHRVNRLRALREKLTKLRFLDPACGCGNFLVIAYRELRRLEHEILDALYHFGTRGKELDLGEEGRVSQVDVHQFYGIEILEWPARIAETALWLTDHQMNTELSLATGNLFQRIPLRAAPHIRCANALRFDWNELLPAKECSYVLGNPPFVGKHLMTADQKTDTERLWENCQGAGSLDYVTCWYTHAAQYTISNPQVHCAFVSTNSISQGEQVSYLWSHLFQNGIKINFAHRTFKWESEAKGKAHVHVVIIGFGRTERERKHIYEYDTTSSEPHVVDAVNISPYLVEGSDTVVFPRSKPLCDVPPTIYGNKPADGGHLMISQEERKILESSYPEVLQYVSPMISAQEYLHGQYRYCLWLTNASSTVLQNNVFISSRLKAVKTFRDASKKGPTRDMASQPSLFAENRQPASEYIVIPRHTSENRKYIPFGYFPATTIVHDLSLIHI